MSDQNIRLSLQQSLSFYQHFGRPCNDKRSNEPSHDKTNKMMCTQRRLRSAWASLCTQWVAKDPSFLHADSEGSDQTGRMPRLIWVFTGRSHFVGFVMLQLYHIIWPVCLFVILLIIIWKRNNAIPLVNVQSIYTALHRLWHNGNKTIIMQSKSYCVRLNNLNCSIKNLKEITDLLTLVIFISPKPNIWITVLGLFILIPKAWVHVMRKLVVNDYRSSQMHCALHVSISSENGKSIP